VGFVCSPPATVLPLCLALFAVFRLVGESLFLEELLFSRRKHELRTATNALDISVNKVHETSFITQKIHEVKGGRSRSVNLAA
jgi:hypothetical protein